MVENQPNIISPPHLGELKFTPAVDVGLLLSSGALVRIHLRRRPGGQVPAAYVQDAGANMGGAPDAYYGGSAHAAFAFKTLNPALGPENHLDGESYHFIKN